MNSLPPNLAAALLTISNALGQDPVWVNIFSKLWLYLEMSKDMLDAANAKNL